MNQKSYFIHNYLTWKSKHRCTNVISSRWLEKKKKKLLEGTLFGLTVTRKIAVAEKGSCILLLLLLSRFSCVWLCATPWTAAHQAPPSMGFSRQEYWSGLLFPSPSCILMITNNMEEWGRETLFGWGQSKLLRITLINKADGIHQLFDLGQVIVPLWDCFIIGI